MAGTGRRARHWVYLDEGRTHEVHAQVDPRPDGYHLAMTEFPAGSRDPAEALSDERELNEHTEVAAALAELEHRLALAGAYHRADLTDAAGPAPAGGSPGEVRWEPLVAPPDARKVDLRAFEVPIPQSPTSGKLAFHHFHASTKGRDALLVSLPRADLQMPRTILAQLDFDFPRIEDGDLRVLHTRLAPGTLRSAVVRQHVELPARGYSKLVEPRDYERAFGTGWVDRARDVFQRAARRVFDIAPHPPSPVPPPMYPTLAAERLARAVALPKVRALRDRYVTPQEAEALFHGGELAIRRFVKLKRKRVDHHAVYDLSVLESLLLVEYGLRGARQALLDEEGAKLLRYAMPRSTA